MLMEIIFHQLFTLKGGARHQFINLNSKVHLYLVTHVYYSVKHGAFNTCSMILYVGILNGNNHISMKISFGPAVRGEGGEAGERKLVGVPKLHSWSKCTMPLMNIQSLWMSNTCHCHMNLLLCILRCSSTLETPSNIFMLFLQY